MKREIICTGDGSHTVSVPAMGVTYHSVHGAIQESRHVFIKAGFEFALGLFSTRPLKIFEMGFGTGLNAFLTALEALERKIEIDYTAVELSPLVMSEVQDLNYAGVLGHPEIFGQLHSSPWNARLPIHPYFKLEKIEGALSEVQAVQSFHLIYYDAFAPSAQPELWTEEIFRKLIAMLGKGGVLVTYCSKGDVRRAMQAAGFTITKIPGPPGKREMVRAMRNE